MYNDHCSTQVAVVDMRKEGRIFMIWTMVGLTEQLVAPAHIGASAADSVVVSAIGPHWYLHDNPIESLGNDTMAYCYGSSGNRSREREGYE